jgi:hypothetical protein
MVWRRIVKRGIKHTSEEEKCKGRGIWDARLGRRKSELKEKGLWHRRRLNTPQQDQRGGNIEKGSTPATCPNLWLF